MIKEKKKVLRIIDAFNAYCFFVGGKNIESKLTYKDGEWKFYFKSEYLPEYKESLLSLEKQINEIECGSTEEMYWHNLNSENLIDENDIYLIASMVENAKVFLSEKEFKVEFTRKNKE